jgi:hypothetical protein
MSRLRAIPLLFALGLPATGFAAAPAAADPALGAQLKRLGYEATADANGDYKILFGLDKDAAGKARSQLTYVRSVVERYGSLKVREIWSVAYQGKDGQLPPAVAERLLADAADSILGGWVSQNGTAAFVVKLAADAPDAALGDAIEAATRSADAMEAELAPGQDEY